MNNGYEIGTTVSGKYIGRDCHLFVWINCPSCNSERWVELNCLLKQQLQGQCHPCQRKSQEHSSNWRGGRHLELGYVFVWIRSDDFFYPMAKWVCTSGGYVAEHRLIVAKELGRNLHSFEIVHHKNGIKADNRIENLQLLGDDRHKSITLLQNKIRRLEHKIKERDREIKLLKQQPRLEVETS